MATIDIFGTLNNATPEGVLAVAKQIKDTRLNKNQEDINKELEENKQNNLVSGENVKTVGGQSIVGSGNIKAVIADNNQSFTEEEKQQIQQNIGTSENILFKGQFDTYTKLKEAYPTADKGSYAFVGNPRHLYEYDTKQADWIDNGDFKYIEPVQELGNSEIDVISQKGVKTAIDNIKTEFDEKNAETEGKLTELGRRIDGVDNSDTSVFYVVDNKGNIVFQIDNDGLKANLYNICNSKGDIILTISKDYFDNFVTKAILSQKVDKESIDETTIADQSDIFEIQDSNFNIVLRISNVGIFLKKLIFTEDGNEELLDYQIIKSLKNSSAGTVGDNPIYDFFYVQIHNRVLFIGDSLTEGQTNGAVQDASRSYPHACAKIGGWDIKNTGFSGITTLSAWQQIKSKQLDVSFYDAVFIYLGTNGGLTDTIDEDTSSGDYNTFAETNTGGYCAIIEYIKANNPKCKIYIIRWNDESATSLVTIKIANKYLCPSFKVKDNRYIDCTSGINHENVDATHYNTLGYLNLARVIMIQLEEYIKEHLSEYTDLTVTQENSDRFN